MDGWNVAQNWAIFIPLAAGLTAYYYWPRDNKPHSSTRGRSQSVVAQSAPVKPSKTTNSKSPKKTQAASHKEKAPTKAAPRQAAPAPTPKVEQKEPISSPEIDDSAEQDAKEFARRLTQARQGVEVKKNETKGGRVKTVKQSNALNKTAEFASGVDTTREAGSVADMLEPAAPGPSTLRILPSEKPTKAHAPKKEVKEVKQSKKARQNERKREAEREQRLEDEKQRKLLEERQRRAAREARGEPAKNGVVPSKAPASSAWDAGSGASTSGTPATSLTNSALLDTFDAESTGSSNLGASTAATSTTDETQSELKDVDRAVKESLDDAAWTTAGSKRKQKGKKATTEPSGDATPVVVTKPSPSSVTSNAANAKPSGFQALVDEYEQRTDVDANDASNWDA